jgi:hypothetical protein
VEAAIRKIPNTFAAVKAIHNIVVITAKSTKWAWDMARMGFGGGGNIYVVPVELQEIHGPDVGGKIDPKEFGPDNMNWIHVVQNRETTEHFILRLVQCIK